MARRAYADFVALRIADIMGNLATAQLEALKLGRTDISARITQVIDGIATDLRAIAEQTALVADANIVAVLAATKGQRPEAAGEHIDQHIESGGLPFGGVQIAYIDELDKLVNDERWGPYWRAQEVGTGADDPILGAVPSQEGRVIYGQFGFGEGDRPLAEHAGVGVGTEGQFMPGGAEPGFGTIHHELPGRHFLRDGTQAAFEYYEAAMHAMEAKWASRLGELTTLLAALP